MFYYFLLQILQRNTSKTEIPKWPLTQTHKSQYEGEKIEEGAWMLLTTDISHCNAAREKKNGQNFTFKFTQFKTEFLGEACWYSGWLLVRLCIMGGRVWNHLCEIQMRVLFYCVLWYNKSFIATGRLIFITLYLVLPPSEKKKKRECKPQERT